MHPRQIEQLQFPLFDNIMDYYHLPSHFSVEILYLDQQLGGMGLPRFSDRVQLFKWWTIQRCMALGDRPEQTVNNFLHCVVSKVNLKQDSIHEIDILTLSIWDHRLSAKYSYQQVGNHTSRNIHYCSAHSFIP